MGGPGSTLTPAGPPGVSQAWRGHSGGGSRCPPSPVGRKQQLQRRTPWPLAPHRRPWLGPPVSLLSQRTPALSQEALTARRSRSPRAPGRGSLFLPQTLQHFLKRSPPVIGCPNTAPGGGGGGATAAACQTLSSCCAGGAWAVQGAGRDSSLPAPKSRPGIPKSRPGTSKFRALTPQVQNRTPPVQSRDPPNPDQESPSSEH